MIRRQALVADLVPRDRLGTAYGVFAAFQGVAALVGGTIGGWHYTDQRGVLIAVLIAAQVVSAALLIQPLRDESLTG